MAKDRPKNKAKRRKVSMKFFAPEAGEVFIVGDFNGWDPTTHPLKKKEEGVWEKVLMLPLGRYEYRFLVDGKWQNDPKNPDFCPNCFGTRNNVLMVCSQTSSPPL
jgi:1,4-alpha-glucan branching enzyme